jgi:hypothetical protein
MLFNSLQRFCDMCRLQYFKPHDGYALGVPNPPCFEERINTAQGIHKSMELRDGELGEHTVL